VLVCALLICASHPALAQFTQQGAKLVGNQSPSAAQQVATDTIDYVATDTDGLTSTSTRTVIIEAAATSTVQ
jgi:hypothetical protein